MDFFHDIEELLDGDKAPEQQWVDETMQRYPYFALPLLLHVKQSGDQETLHRLSIMSPDRRDLSIVVGNAPSAFAKFYPVEQSTSPDFDNLIDIFFENYAHGTNQKEIDALSNAIFNPTPDYADILAAQEEDNEKTHDHEDELIDSFIAHSREQEKEALSQQTAVEHHVEEEQVAQVAHDNVEKSTQNDDSMLSESLAKVYIARGKYLKALEIIESINLNFPEKSIYFADQIRFLRKLVLNETTKNKL
ncbi:MAG: hypothetical protein IKX31_02035 [Muribaculaceae bacterium]|nr:hypothetical protein [Muribaculaceae bacterium]